MTYRGSFRKIIKGGQILNVADPDFEGAMNTPHARGVWGHAPPGNLDPLRSLLVHFQVNLHYL